MNAIVIKVIPDNLKILETKFGNFSLKLINRSHANRVLRFQAEDLLKLSYQPIMSGHFSELINFETSYTIVQS